MKVNCNSNENFDIFFCVNIDLLQKFFFWEGDWLLGYVSTWNEIFMYSNTPQVVRQLVKQPYKKIFILEIKLSFTCCETHVYCNVVKFRNIMSSIVDTFLCNVLIP